MTCFTANVAGFHGSLWTVTSYVSCLVAVITGRFAWALSAVTGYMTDFIAVVTPRKQQYSTLLGYAEEIFIGSTAGEVTFNIHRFNVYT